MKTSQLPTKSSGRLSAFLSVALFGVLASLTPVQAAVTVSSKTVTTNGMARSSAGLTENWNFGDALTTFNGWQYLAYWNNDGATNGAQYHVSVARRQLPDGNWQVITLGDYFRNQLGGENSVAASFGDGHEKVALGVSPDGYIHLAFDHHVDALHYRRTLTPIAANPATATWDAAQFGPVQDNLGGARITEVTYPSFYADYSSGNFAFYYRSPGGSGNGDSNFATYSNGAWNQKTPVESKFIDNVTARSPDGHVNAYPQGIVVRGNTVYITWVWRQTPDGTTNFDLCHAFSTDFGATWRDGQNTLIGTRGAIDNTNALISANDPGAAGIFIAVGQIKNTGAMCMDANKNIHVICPGPTGSPVHYMWRAARDANGNALDSGGTWSAALPVPTSGNPIAGPNNRLFLVTAQGLYETDSTNPTWNSSSARVANAPSNSINGGMDVVIDDSRLSSFGILTVVGQNSSTTITSVDYNIGDVTPPTTAVAAPVFSPAGGTYSSAQNVTLSTATNGASIRYTLDNASPTATTGTLYSGPITLSTTTIVRAIAYKSGSPDSAVSTATYIISATPPSSGPSPTPSPTPAPPTTPPSNSGGGGGGSPSLWFLATLATLAALRRGKSNIRAK